MTFPVTDNEILVSESSFSGSLIEELSIKSPYSFGKSAFADCKNLKTAVFDSDIKISGEAFNRCNSLISVEFNGAASVDPRAFRECTS